MTKVLQPLQLWLHLSNQFTFERMNDDVIRRHHNILYHSIFIDAKYILDYNRQKMFSRATINQGLLVSLNLFIHQ